MDNQKRKHDDERPGLSGGSAFFGRHTRVNCNSQLFISKKKSEPRDGEYMLLALLGQKEGFDGPPSTSAALAGNGVGDGGELPVLTTPYSALATIMVFKRQPRKERKRSHVC